MARPPLAIGHYGNINTKRVSPEGVKPESWRARCHFRDLDGVTRQVERYGTSRTKAERALQDACQERAGKPVQQINNTTRIAELVDIYLEQFKARAEHGERSLSTYDRYVTAARVYIKPNLGGLLVRECSTTRMQDVLDDMRDKGLAASTRGNVRSVMHGMLQVAIRREIIKTNPARELDRIENVTPRKKARALSLAEFQDFMGKLDMDEFAQRNDVPDITRVFFGTGMRLGEALALRWCDLNMTDQPVRMHTEDGLDELVPPRSLWINGGVIYVVGTGVVRNQGKSFTARRILGMPDFLHTFFLVRRDEYAQDTDPIFPGFKAPWRYPRTVTRNMKTACERIGYPQVTTHWGRKTVGYLLDDAGHSARQVADVLGHSNIGVTQKHYMARGMANPGAVAAIDAWHQPKGA